MDFELNYLFFYKSPENFSDIILTSDGEYLTGLWFIKSNNDLKHGSNYIEKDLHIFEETRKWLDIYFGGEKPNFIPKYKINNMTHFKKDVINEILKIEYGEINTYGNISDILARRYNIKKMSAQAVGSAVGSNPICIIIPCHRVIGKNGEITGYSGGTHNKIELLRLEGVDVSKFIVQKKAK